MAARYSAAGDDGAACVLNCGPPAFNCATARAPQRKRAVSVSRFRSARGRFRRSHTRTSPLDGRRRSTHRPGRRTAPAHRHSVFVGGLRDGTHRSVPRTNPGEGPVLAHVGLDLHEIINQGI
jgi:hypothetical protein